jgi:CRP-like cAMP-binding protein
MQQIEFKQNETIFAENGPVKRVLIITKGAIEAKLDAHTCRFEPGEAVDLCALTEGTHGVTYTAASDGAALAYDYADMDGLEVKLKDSASASGILVNSMRRQMCRLLQYRENLKTEADGAYDLITEVYPQYEKMCKLYALAPKKLTGVAGLKRVSENDTADDWLYGYYMELNDMPSGILKDMFAKGGFAWGFLRIGAKDIRRVLQSCKIHQDYLKKIGKVLLNAEGHDIVSLISELHADSTNIKGSGAVLSPIMERLADVIGHMTYIDQTMFTERLSIYKKSVGRAESASKGAGGKPVSAARQNLMDSLNVITSYSGLEEEKCNKFIQGVTQYTNLPDRTCPEEDAYKLRRGLTNLFYDLYQAVFIKSLKDTGVPTVIKMFLNFGYVDATLAGRDNTDYLYSIADSLKGDPKSGVYTAREWLTAIYEGKKEPSRNELDTDYSGYLRELRQGGKITVEEEKKMLGDLMGRLRYEIENVFPIANKITYGRLDSFCPLFSDHNVQKSLELSMVTPELIDEGLRDILKTDFTAFSREVLYSNSEINIANLSLTADIRPNFILMPNVGIRGAMWQDIEGRNRSTAARTFLPLFLGVDLKAMLVRLTGEFRWEMCKRIKGVRWSDVTEPSLTSEFFDYLQFYKTNRELSTEVKNAVKTELIRARNIYKSVFVNNYTDWILYEANGSQRLNKYIRKVFALYCPFPSDVREKLEQNPQYVDAMKRYSQARHRNEKVLSNLAQKITNSGARVPKEVLEEIEKLKK